MTAGQSSDILVLSGLLVTTFTSFYNEFYSKPHINIVVQGDIRNIHRDIITITNDGRVPATNLVLNIPFLSSNSALLLITTSQAIRVFFACFDSICADIGHRIFLL